MKHAQSAVQKSEKEIERLEQKIKEMDDNLLDPVFYQEALKDNSVFDLYNELKASLEKELLLWEERQAVVERLQ